jgi:hypothetical protein
MALASPHFKIIAVIGCVDPARSAPIKRHARSKQRKFAEVQRTDLPAAMVSE